MLVFQDFWMSGDCNGRWMDPKKAEDQQTRRKYPDDHGLFLRSVADGIKLIRNHASLAIWCGGNEITPPADILSAMKDSLLPSLDGTRVFFDYSNSDSMSLNILKGGGDGPYEIQPTDTFWKFRTYPFNSEVGSVGIGDFESLTRFIPLENTAPPVYTAPSESNPKGMEKADSVWDYHKYIGYKQYISRYGKVKDTRDFANKAQLINYDQYRALMEGFSAHAWEWYTGSIIWKTQNPWTALRGQMYDYYLDPNACLFGLRSGSEPVHIMYNPVEGMVMTVNNSFETISRAVLVVKGLTMIGSELVLAQDTLTLDATAFNKWVNIKQKVEALRENNGIFLSLELIGSNQQLLSHNIYWLPDATNTYSGLQALKQVSPAVKVRKITPGKIEVIVSNAKGNTLAFFNRISLLNAATKERILPVFYDNNYITVLPGKEQKVIIEYTDTKGPTMISIEGWNVPVKEYPVP
jgi:hypothetical protein